MRHLGRRSNTIARERVEGLGIFAWRKYACQAKYLMGWHVEWESAQTWQSTRVSRWDPGEIDFYAL